MSTASPNLPAAAASRLVAVPPPQPSAETRPPTLVAVPPLGSSDGEHPWGDIPEPDPEQVEALAVLVFEVVEGLRGIAQLGAAITLSAARELTAVRAARQEQRAVLREPGRPVSGSGPVRVDRPATGVAEVASVVYVGERARAVAMRMEWLHRRWRATEIAVL